MLARTLLCLIVALAGTSAHAQTASGDFYERKTITIVTSTGVGGLYDLIARLVACWTLIVSLWPEAETRPIDPAVDARPFLGVPLLPLNWSERGL